MKKRAEGKNFFAHVYLFEGLALDTLPVTREHGWPNLHLESPLGRCCPQGGG